MDLNDSRSRTRAGILGAVGAALFLLPGTVLAGPAIHLLNSEDGFWLLLIVMLLLPYILGPLFTIVYLFSRRGAYKWTAIICTAILLIYELWMEGKWPQGWAAILPYLCFSLILTKLRARSEPRRYWIITLLWAAALLQVTHYLSQYPMSLVYSYGASGMYGVMAVSILLRTLVVGIIAIQALKGARRCGLGIPSLPEFAGYAVLLTLLDAVLGTLITQVQLLLRYWKYGVESFPFNYRYITISTLAAGLAAAIAWYLFDRRRASDAGS